MMLDSTVVACRPVVEVWLPSLSSERASNKEVLSVSSTLGAEPGQEPSFRAMATSVVSFHFLLPSAWEFSPNVQIQFFFHTRAAVWALPEECWLHSAQLSSLCRAQSDPSLLLSATCCAVWRAFQPQCAAGFTAQDNRPWPRLQQPRCLGGCHRSECLFCLPATPLRSQRYHWHTRLCQSVCAATTAHCLCLSL